MKIDIGEFLNKFEDDEEAVGDFCEFLSQNNLKLKPAVMSHVGETLSYLTLRDKEQFEYEEYMKIVKCIYGAISHLGENLNSQELCEYLRNFGWKTPLSEYSNFGEYLDNIEKHLKIKYNAELPVNSRFIEFIKDNPKISNFVVEYFYNSMPTSMQTGDMEKAVIEYLKLIE